MKLENVFEIHRCKIAISRQLNFDGQIAKENHPIRVAEHSTI